MDEATPMKRAANREKFELELEFLQCLANPLYVHELATSNHLDDPSFVNYLEYLEYWKQPEYAKFILYPTSLKMLDLLKTPTFRQKFKDPAYVDALSHQMLSHWATWQDIRPETKDVAKEVPVTPI